MKPYAFGIDIGGTTVKIGLFKTEGNLLEKWEIPTRVEENGSRIIPDIADAVNGKMQDRKMQPEDVQGIGIGVPGPVLNESIVNRCVNLGWGIVDVAKEMSRLTGIENAAAGNDANVAALGEMWKGAGKGRDNVVMITLGTGVGGGIILNGKILSGIHGAAGEIGHIKVSDDEELLCGCGKKGHLEQYASATGIVRKVKEILLDGVKKYYRETVFHASENTEIALAECGNDAGIYGAVKMILP